MQAMAELVKQSGHFIVSEKRRTISHRCCEVAREIGHRYLDAAFASLAGNRIVHPCAAAL